MMKKRCGIIKNYGEWIRPKLVVNSLELLEKEIPRYKKKIKFVHLCFATDPFMYKYPEVSKLTLKIIDRLNKDNIRCVVLTKGFYPKSLKDKIKYGNNNEYGITLVSLKNNFKKQFEPFTAPYRRRINSLKYLHRNGLKTWVSMEPYPTPNLIEQDLTKILKQVSFVDKIIFGKLNYNVKSSQFIDNSNFYEKCAEKVVSFCRKNDIEYHIKFGTQKNFNKRTKKIFCKEETNYNRQPAFSLLKS